MRVSHRTVAVIAAFVWYGGGISLILKSASLVKEALHINPGANGPLVALGIGIVAGLLKGRFIFVRSCRRNLARIAALRAPRPWQCFSPVFMVLLALMITAGATMSRTAAGNYAGLCAVAALDAAIATALLTSSAVFWREKAFSRTG